MSGALFKILLIVIYALLSAGGLVILKVATPLFSLPYLAGLAIYGIAFAIWIFIILPLLPLSVAFPISAGAIVVMTVLLGHVALGEPATGRKIAGSILIIVGILAIYLAPDSGVSPAQPAPAAPDAGDARHE
jgi:multidrug transporter EmrE-like cation transporter